MPFNPLSWFRSDGVSQAELQALRDELDLSRRMDAYHSETLGYGTSEDKAISDWQFSAECRLSYQQIDALYRSNGIGKRIIDHPASEATREWVSLQCDKPHADKLTKALNEIDADILCTTGLAWSSAYRGAGVILDVDDRQSVEAPVNESGIRSVYPRYIVDARYLQPQYVDPWTPVEYYRLMTGDNILIHESRILIFDGIDCGMENRQSNYGWGESQFDIINRPLVNQGADYGLASTLLKDQSVMVFKEPNFASNVKKNGGKYALKSARARRRLASAVQAILLDKEEEFEFVNRNLAHTKELIELGKDHLCAYSWIPHSELYGESPGASLGEGGAYQSRSFYNMVRGALQKKRLASPLRRLLTYKAAELNLPAPGFTFRSLWQLTPKEKSQIYRETASGDAIYHKLGVPAQTFYRRFSDDGFQQDITIDAADLAKAEQEKKKLEKQQRELGFKLPKENKEKETA
jgi:phage-related protein (TIGR01555 family)